MKNQIIEAFIFIGFIIIIVGINHVSFGNSNSTVSLYDGMERQVVLKKRKIESKKLAKYMYKRIKYWQSIHKIWQEQERQEYENQKNKIKK